MAHYANEKHTLILISLMKAHGIKKIIASPGSTNASFVGSLQSDPYFEIYSSVDERSAAYMAVGMAAESGECIAITCTGSTASRDYIPGLTEAYYRKLPVLAITASQHLGRVGQYRQQVLDRSSQLADMVTESVTVDCVYTDEDEKACVSKINKAILALKRDGGGPSHINLVTTYCKDFSCADLPKCRTIKRICPGDLIPDLEKYKHIAVLVGVHEKWNDALKSSVEEFCEKYDAVVFGNHASNYKGKYGLNLDIFKNLDGYSPSSPCADVVIYIGSIARYLPGNSGTEMWRVNPDGEIRDVEYKTTYVFQMSEVSFFETYNKLKKDKRNNTYAKEWQEECGKLVEQIPEVPFSNVWIARTLGPHLPNNSVFHISGSNTARAWNYVKIDDTIECFSNDGMMGIDGQMSSMIGESLISPKRIHFGAFGDLTFFYDMNCLGNRHVGNNVRILVVNNGIGTEFKVWTSQPGATLGAETDKFIAAKGHFGNKSKSLIRHYAEDLGFEYLTASSKEEFQRNMKKFVTPTLTEKPIIYEVFTDSKDESESVYMMNHVVTNSKGKTISFAKSMIKTIAGDKGIETVKKIVKK